MEYWNRSDWTIFKDTMLQAFVIDASKMKFGIDAVTEEYLGLKKIPTEELIGKGKKQKSMC